MQTRVFTVSVYPGRMRGEVRVRIYKVPKGKEKENGREKTKKDVGLTKAVAKESEAKDKPIEELLDENNNTEGDTSNTAE